MNQYTLFSHVNKQAYTVNQNQNCLRMYNQSSTTWRPSQYESFIVCIQMDFRFGGFLFFFFFFYRTFVLEALTRSYQPCSSFDGAISMTIHVRCFRHCVWPLNGYIMWLNLFIIQLSYTVRIPIFWLVDLYHVTLGYDATTSLTSLSWCNSRGVNSIHHSHYTMALADSKFDDFCLQCIQFE